MGSLAQMSSAAIRCSFNTRFRARFRRVQKVPEQILRLVSGRFWCIAPVKVRKGSAAEPGEVSEGSGAEPRGGFWKVPVQ